jgi:hypothetical protein
MKPSTSIKIGAVLIAVIILLTWMSISCSHDVEAFNEKHDIERLSTGDRIYETVYKGHTYIIVETHRGVGICQKAGDVVWTKEVK